MNGQTTGFDLIIKKAFLNTPFYLLVCISVYFWFLPEKILSGETMPTARKTKPSLTKQMPCHNFKRDKNRIGKCDLQYPKQMNGLIYN